MLSIIQESRKCLQKRFISFAQMGVNSKIVKRLDGINIKEATSIQEKVIPLGLQGISPIAISSETGSGKTLSYLIPYLNSYMVNPNQRLLVILPRKELAYQFDDVLHSIFPEIESAVAVGKWQGLTATDFPKVIVGTPKTIYTFVRKAFQKCDIEKLNQYQRAISYIVLDEADVILNEPFQLNVLDTIRILRKINPSINILAAGATIPRNGKCTPGGILNKMFPNLVWCEDEHSNMIPTNVNVNFVELQNEMEKETKLKDYLPKLSSCSSLLFVQNAKQGNHVMNLLKQANIKCQLFCQDLTDTERDQAMRRLLTSNSLCTVCTDIVSRGINTMNINKIIQYDFAKDISTFIHRCGRTGRNGNKGEVTCFVTPENTLLYSQIQKIGVHNDLSGLYSRKRNLRKKEKKAQKNKEQCQQ